MLRSDDQRTWWVWFKREKILLFLSGETLTLKETQGYATSGTFLLMSKSNDNVFTMINWTVSVYFQHLLHCNMLLEIYVSKNR